MSAKHELTTHAIMYISVGFTQQSILQVLSIREGTHSSLEMVVYDGLVYIGALYDYSTQIRRLQSIGAHEEPYHNLFEENSMQGEHHTLPKQFDIIKVTAVLVAKNQPLYSTVYARLIRELRVVQTGWVEPLGKEILTLEQYMKRRKFFPFVKFDQDDSFLTLPSKKVKQNEVTLLNGSQNKEEREQQREDQRQPLQINEVFQEKEDQNKIVQAEKEGKQVEEQDELEELQASEIVNKYSKRANISTERSNENGDFSEHSRVGQVCKIMPNHQTKSLQASDLHSHDDSKNQYAKSEGAVPSQKVLNLLLQDDCEITKVRNTKNNLKKDIVIDLVDEPQSLAPTQKGFLPKTQKLSSESFTMIEDLYQRMHRFRMMCRINLISTFTSQKGNLCTKLMLVDEKGDQVLCILFDKATERIENKQLELTKGRAYIFDHGEVEKDQTGALSVSIPWSGIHETKNVLNSFHPDKMMRVGQIQNIDSSHFLQRSIKKGTNSINTPKAYSKQINVCGIFMGFKDEPKLSKTQFRIIGILCDPDQQTSVSFGLYVDELVSFPQQGTVISLHNMRATHNDRVYRLQNTKRSYYLIERQNKHKYFADLLEESVKQTWKLKSYKNLSEVEYIMRTIGQLKHLLGSMMEHDQCYSQLDCNIASIYEKKEFFACIVCKHETKPEKGLRTYCYHCKKIQKWVKRFIFSSEVADSTGSIVVTVFSQEIQSFINCQLEEYINMTVQDRKTLLELSAYQNVVLKVKSQRILGGSSHFVTRTDRGSHKRGLENIKDKQIQNKTKYVMPW